MPEGFDPDAFAQVFGGGSGGAQAGGFGDLGDMFANLFGNAGPFTRGRGRAARRREARTWWATWRSRSRTRPSGATDDSIGKWKIGERQHPGWRRKRGSLARAGQGAPAPKSGQPGDLYLDIVVRSDAHLRRTDDDVELALPLTLGEAVLGTHVDVPTWMARSD